MLLFSIFFTLLYLSSNNCEPVMQERDVYHTLFGNIGSMKDLFLKEPDPSRRSEPAPEPNPVPNTADDDDDLEGQDLEIHDTFKFDRANLTEHSFDINDFLIINEKYSNVTKEYKEKMKNMSKNQTRRQFTKYLKYENDPDDRYYGEYIEHIKREQLRMVLTQFNLHCRYEVGKVLLQRDLVRTDKRYQLGYLFNRMRRLKTEQLKMVGSSWQLVFQYNRFRHMYTQMRMYERVIHFDIDMRDTAALIRRIFEIDAPYDKIETKGGGPE